MANFPLLTYLVFLQGPTGVPITEPATYLGLKPSEWIMIAAIILGPIFAVLTQLGWQRWKEGRDRKAWVFATLMGLRAQPLHAEYVRALNAIDVAFYKSEKVRGRWAALLAHFYSDAYKKEPIDPATFERARDLNAQLLAEMAEDLGYEYDYTHIKENAYHPLLHGTVEASYLTLLQKGTEIVEGKSSIRVKLEE